MKAKYAPNGKLLSGLLELTQIGKQVQWAFTRSGASIVSHTQDSRGKAINHARAWGVYDIEAE